MNIFCMLYQCSKGFSSADICLIITMIIPKLLLLLVPFLCSGQTQIGSQGGNGLTRTPIRDPIIYIIVRRISNENSETSNINIFSNVFTEENIITSFVSYVKATPSLINVGKPLNKKTEEENQKHDLTIIYPGNHQENTSSLIFQTNEKLPGITMMPPVDKTDPIVNKNGTSSSTENTYLFTEKIAATPNFSGSTLYQHLTETPNIEEISKKALSEVATLPINLLTKSESQFKPSVKLPLNFPLNLKTLLITNQAPNYRTNLNQHPKSAIPSERSVNTQSPTWNLSGRPSYALPKTSIQMKPITRFVPQRKTRTFYSNINNQLQTCTKANGYYSISSQCDTYIECENYKAYQNMCPRGLYFDPVAIWPAFPCAYPSEVKCQSQFSIKQEESTEECPRRYGIFPVPKGDCGQFIMCQEGLGIQMSCPAGLAFNAIKSTCDWPVNVPGCNPDIFQDFICPMAPMGTSDERSQLIYNYRYKESCKKYIACQEERPRLLSCDAGLSFDENKQKCVNSNLIKNCKN